MPPIPHPDHAQPSTTDDPGLDPFVDDPPSQEVQSPTLDRDLVFERLAQRGTAATTQDLICDLLERPPSLADILSSDEIQSLTGLQRGFLTGLLITGGNKTKAGTASGVPVRYHDLWMTGREGVAHDSGSAMYREVYPVIWEAAVDHLEAIVHIRAVHGHKQYKFDRHGNPLLWPPGTQLEGQPYFEYKTSDILLERLMRAKRPDQFRPNVEVEIDLGAIANELTEDQLLRIAQGESPRKVLKNITPRRLTARVSGVDEDVDSDGYSDGDSNEDTD
jgi:hypothetical protein